MSRQIMPIVIGVVRKQNKFLLTKRADSEWHSAHEKVKHLPWQFPGGQLEFGESAEECLHREIKEETNLNVKIIKLIPKIYHQIRDNWHGLFICYLCQMVDENQEVVINEEASDYNWHTVSEIKDLPYLPLTYEIAKCANTLM